MNIDKNRIAEHNQRYAASQQRRFEQLAEELPHVADVVNKLMDVQVAIPSWPLGTGGTRFGRFSGGGEPRNLEDKIADIGLLHALNRSSGAIPLHIPWDIPQDYAAIRSLASQYDLRFEAMNSNTFQDQPGQSLSYKFGSMQHVDRAVRKQAVDHNVEVIKHGVELGSKS